MKKIIIAGMVVLFILLPVVAAIGCQQPDTPSPPAAEPEIPTHFTTYTDEAGLFSISYPPDWEPALSLIEGLEQNMKDLLESVESDLPLERTSVIFFAGVPTEMGYEPHVNILVESMLTLKGSSYG